MSNIGKKPIQLADNVEVKQEDGKIIVEGPKGTLETKLPSGIVVENEDGKLRVRKAYESKELEKYLGLARALLANMVEGVTTGFEKKLELSGVGFRARIDGKDLVLQVGYTMPVKVTAPEGIQFNVSEEVITVSGANKELVGDVAAKIRKVRPPEPYKGKGIKYQGERIRRKVGKAAKVVGVK